MSYLLGGTEIPRPQSMSVSRMSQYAQNKTLDGSVNRDYFGEDKLVFVLEYGNLLPADYTTLLGRYDEYIANGLRFFDTTGEAVVYGTLVHVDLVPREYTVKGSSYISDTTLVLTEG